MKIFTRNSDLKSFIDQQKSAQRKIAFIPTMGALHSGHLSLIQIGKEYAEITICSIFVNPRQFNNTDDLKKYPRTPEKDIQLLEDNSCDVLFFPDDAEIYPKNIDTSIHINLGILDKVMEGQFRPGHFNGMLQVVKRLLDIVNPDYLVMGQKDFQQFTLVHSMLEQLHIPIKLIIGPTLRDPDGLAMSSRNQRLNSVDRIRALIIYKTLIYVKNNISKESVKSIENIGLEDLNNSGLKPEYLEIVDGNTLEKISNPEQHTYIVVCIAAWAGEVRLIDNMIVKGGLN